ncbi:restriction endonuclease subunit S [Intestinibacter bartlettii]|uniref:restriction endonuclease subunit S n=1 Tax=Intestinibacter bartlettii TaxID=261299 RepID=UPI00319E9ADE
MVPKLRFKEFCGEWEEKKVENLCKIHTGKSNTQDKVEDGIYPFFVRSPIIERSNKYLYDCEAVLTVGDGVGTGKVYHYINGKFDCHQRVYVMRNFKDINGKYFYYYFSNNFYKRVQKMSARNSVDSVRMDMISKMNIALPSLSEQTKIADFLSTVDDKIKNQQDKITHLENIKKGFMQKIFSRKIRFKDDGGEEFPEWEEKKLGDIANIYDGTHQTPNYVSSGIPFVSVENIKDLYKTKKYIELEAFKREFKIYPQKNDILMTRIGDIGTPCIVKKNDKIAYYVSLALIKINKNNKVISNFLLQYIKNSEFQRELWKRTLHIAFPKKINKSEISKCLIYLPCLKEQQKIADFLSSFDEKISTEKEILEHLKRLKKGLLQQMFV